jgi:putative membrane protein
MSFKMIVISIIVVLFFVFVLQNLANVTVNFLFFTMSMPRIISLAIGILIGILIPVELRKSKKIKTGT